MDPPPRMTHLDVLSRSGEHIDLIEHLESPVVIVDFWATWCVPCIAEIPYLNRLDGSHGQRVEVVGLLIDGSENGVVDMEVLSVLDRLKPGYEVFLASESTLMQIEDVCGRKVDAIPTKLFLSSERDVVFWLKGALGPSIYADLIERMDHLAD